MRNFYHEIKPCAQVVREEDKSFQAKVGLCHVCDVTMLLNECKDRLVGNVNASIMEIGQACCLGWGSLENESTAVHKLHSSGGRLM